MAPRKRPEPSAQEAPRVATKRSTTDQPAPLVCPLCYVTIAPAEAARDVDGKRTHEICWIGWRKRRQATNGAS